MQRSVLCIPIIIVSLGCAKPDNNGEDLGTTDADGTDAASVEDMPSVEDIGAEDSGLADMGAEDLGGADLADVRDDDAGDMMMPPSCATATTLELGTDGSGTIDTEGARKFFTIAPDVEGQWLEILVVPSDAFDLVSVVRNMAGEQIALGQPVPGAPASRHVVYRTEREPVPGELYL